MRIGRKRKVLHKGLTESGAPCSGGGGGGGNPFIVASENVSFSNGFSHNQKLSK